MSKTRIKICGLTRVEEVSWCSALGVDAIGLVFYANSLRAVDVPKAQQLLSTAPPFVTVTALFMNASPDDVHTVLDAAPIDLLQFHGQESAAYCDAFHRPYIKAIPMGGGVVDADYVCNYVASYPKARGFLFDSHLVGHAGGSGKTFDWHKMPAIECPIILAGGINTDNVGEAISAIHPYAVDVSSGVEKVPGQKDHSMIKQFMKEVQLVDQRQS